MFVDRAEIMIRSGKGGDDTLFAKIDGTVKFERYDKKRKQISVYSKEA